MTAAWLAAAAALGMDARPAGADEPAAQAHAAERRRERGARASIWDGVYTEAQARRGEYVYPGPCGRCHGVRLNGAPDDPDMLPAPPIAGRKFLRKWDGRSLAALLEYVRTTMPENNPRSLSDGEYADLVAYMLLVSGAPAGTAELRPEPGALSGIEIRNAP
ncbi:MAG TPA: cytochrome c [Gammaproteobacteria bacterium]